MKRILLTLLFATLLPLVAGAQEKDLQWVDVTALNHAATNGKDLKHCLKQYLLFDNSVLEQHPDIEGRYRTFAGDFMQMMLQQTTPENVKEIDEAIAQVKKMIEMHPELADDLKAQLKEMESMRGQISDMGNTGFESYSEDPVKLLKDMTVIAVNKKAYSGWRDIGGGLYSVSTAPRYGSADSGNNMVDEPEGSLYTWGAINSDGKEIIPLKYAAFSDCHQEEDIIFLVTSDKKGNLRWGAVGYDGRVRIPFDYDEMDSRSLDGHTAAMWKNGKMGIVSFDGKQLQPFEYTSSYFMGEWYVSKDGKNHGIISPDGRLVIPLKYKSLWDACDGEIKLERTDGRLDVFKMDTYELLRTDPAPDMD